jgi:hypothetical protein
LVGAGAFLSIDRANNADAAGDPWLPLVTKGKVLVLFDSATDNTGKMAGLIAESADSIPGIEVRLQKIDPATADDVVWRDGLALGCPEVSRSD